MSSLCQASQCSPAHLQKLRLTVTISGLGLRVLNWIAPLTFSSRWSGSSMVSHWNLLAQGWRDRPMMPPQCHLHPFLLFSLIYLCLIQLILIDLLEISLVRPNLFCYQHCSLCRTVWQGILSSNLFGDLKANPWVLWARLASSSSSFDKMYSSHPHSFHRQMWWAESQNLLFLWLNGLKDREFIWIAIWDLRLRRQDSYQWTPYSVHLGRNWQPICSCS